MVAQKKTETVNKKNRTTIEATTAGARRFKGVRMRSWGKWVSEIRLPNTRARLWLGSFSTAEAAARAFDVAVTCLRGRSAVINFPDSPPEFAPMGLPHAQIQQLAAAAATKYAAEAGVGSPQCSLSSSDGSSSTFSSPTSSSSSSTTFTTTLSQEDSDDLASCETTHDQDLKEALSLTVPTDDFSAFFKHLLMEDRSYSPLSSTMASSSTRPLLLRCNSTSWLDSGCLYDTFVIGEDDPHFSLCHPISYINDVDCTPFVEPTLWS